jgi:hypothetical protein
VKYEVLTVVKMTVLFLWVFSPEDGESMFHQSTGAASKPRRATTFVL